MSSFQRAAPKLIAFVALLLALAVGVWRSGIVGGQRTGPATQSKPTAGGPASAARDLDADELAGGHTLSRHVGLDSAALRARLANEPSLAVASSFTDRATAERAVAALLSMRTAEIERWLARERGERFVVAARLSGGPIGLSLRRGAREPAAVQGVRAVLVRRGGQWFVLTAYPEEVR